MHRSKGSQSQYEVGLAFFDRRIMVWDFLNEQAKVRLTSSTGPILLLRKEHLKNSTQQDLSVVSTKRTKVDHLHQKMLTFDILVGQMFDRNVEVCGQDTS